MFAGISYRAKSRRPYRLGEGKSLARFSGGSITHPALFGGGHPEALVGWREQTIAYGYAAVLEQFGAPDDSATWITLSVSLPNNVPKLVVDHDAVLGTFDVPPSFGTRVITGDLEFGRTYIATAEDDDAARYLLTPELREVLQRRPVQRLAFLGTRMTLRSFDGPGIDRGLVESLHETATEVLQATPAFVSRLHGTWTTFPPGITGPRL